MKSFKFLAMTIMISSLLAFAAACGNGDSTEGNGSEDKTSDEAAQLEGEVGIDGSSTVAPIGEAVSEEFSMDYKDVKAPIGVSGTGGGFEKFVSG